MKLKKGHSVVISRIDQGYLVSGCCAGETPQFAPDILSVVAMIAEDDAELDSVCVTLNRMAPGEADDVISAARKDLGIQR
ncbi:MAG: hypothetical protein R3253_08905 [Longimicrobiales bacterium]|nr:hypothetical protein [Longimicrobiales bacterium]